MEFLSNKPADYRYHPPGRPPVPGGHPHDHRGYAARPGDLDSIGYYSLECWGGATFDACMRFLGEDPWERLRTIRKHVKNTKLQMLFRGQNILAISTTPTTWWTLLPQVH